MATLRMQPTFRLVVPGGADEVVGKLRQAIAQPDFVGHADSAGRCFDFRVDSSEQRIWSPHLSVQASDLDGETELYGRFSPRPEIWTMFMMVYFSVATIVIGGLVFGAAQWTLGWSVWGFVVAALGIVLLALLHVASSVGQSLGADQMRMLHKQFDQVRETALGASPE